MLHIQLSDNTKARLLDSELKNEYVPRGKNEPVKSQLEIYHFLAEKKMQSPAHPRFDDKEHVAKTKKPVKPGKPASPKPGKARSKKKK